MNTYITVASAGEIEGRDARMHEAEAEQSVDSHSSSTPLAYSHLSPHTFDYLYIQNPRRWLVLVLILYLAVSSLFAVQTPAWQAPDEPAHYNYIAHIVNEAELPVLHWGDYDQRYLDYLKRKGFPSDRSIERVRYESYQPPLYYLSAAPVYWLSSGNLTALRLYNVLLGGMSILLTYLCLHTVFPHKHMITVGATAFAALLPMHVAVAAAVNNDGLAELLVLAALLTLLRWSRGVLFASPAQPYARLLAGTNWRSLCGLSILLGLGLLTKAYAYFLLPLVTCAVLYVLWRQPHVRWLQSTDSTENEASQTPHPEPRIAIRGWQRFRFAAVHTLWVVVPALCLGLPLWLRNMRHYGFWDPLGLNFHDRVVIGQMTTAEWIAHHGSMSLIERGVDFTFKSFWGVFGWLGIFMDGRIYTALLIFTGVLALGLLWGLVRLVSGPPDIEANSFQRWTGVFFVLMIGLVTFAYLWYNMKFVQHQGRYFFWGLLPISTFVAIAWREVMRPVQGIITGGLFGVLGLALGFTGYWNGTLDKWMLLTIGLFAAFLLLQPLLLIGTTDRSIRWMPVRVMQVLRTSYVTHMTGLLRVLAWATPFILLALLDVVSLFAFILPQLQK